MSEMNSSNGTSSEDQAQEVNKSNPLGLVGFIFALSNFVLISRFLFVSNSSLWKMSVLICIVWYLGLIFSLNGFFRTNKSHTKNKDFAITGLIISCISLPLVFLISTVLF